MSGRRGAIAVAILALACGRTSPSPAASPPEPAATVPEPEPTVRELPAVFEHGRIFVQLRTADGQPLRLYTDTGGGTFVSADAVERLGLAVTEVDLDGRVRPVAAMPPLDRSTWIPPLVRVPGLPVSDERSPLMNADGLLGQAWFADHVWIFDYPGRRLSLADEAPPRCPDAHRIGLGFPERDGRRLTNYPRITANIDGEPIELLFDTGATLVLTEAALAALGDGGPELRAGSFVVRSRFERWRAAHPEWRVIAGADRVGGPSEIIEVPVVEVAGQRLGPVWFAVREDRNFHEFMSQFMDRRIDGALGGSAFARSRITAHYPQAWACFESG